MTRDSNGRFASTAVVPSTPSTNGSHVPALVESKPLNQSQVNNLKLIVKTDMDNLLSSFEQDLDRRARSRFAVIEAEHGATEGGSVWRQKYSELLDDFRTRIDAMDLDCKEAGFSPRESVVTMTMHRSAYADDFWRRVGAEEARRQVQNSVEAIKRSVRTTLSREQSKVERAILIQSLPGAPAALDLIKNLPTPEDLWAKVEAELSEKDADLVAAFME